MQSTYHAPAFFMHHSAAPSRPSHFLRSSLLIGVMLAALLPLATPAAAAPPAVAPPAIVPFEQWAPAACPHPTGEDPAPIRRLVVHHTHEPVAHTPEEVLRALALTCKAHTDRGFSTIGYHYVVDPWGGVWQGRGALPGKDGRPPVLHGQGAHVAGSNARAVGVVFLGDHADAPPTAAALTAATQLMAWLIQDTGVDPSAKVPTRSSGVGTARFLGAFHPQAVSGHSDSNHTECPGEHLRQLLDPMRDRMRQLLAGQKATSWDGLAVDRPAAADKPAADKPAADEPQASDKPATDAAAPSGEAGAASAAPSDDAGAASAAPSDDADAEAPASSTSLSSLSSLPASLAPLVSSVDRAAGALRTSGLLSLAARLTGSPDA